MTAIKRSLKLAAVASVLAALPATAVLAGGKPKGAKATPPEVIQQLYAGKTSNWNSGGHAYWAPDGRFQGINKTKDAVGIGKWYVTSRSKLCHEANWHKAEGGAVKAYPHKSCWQFVTAPDGTVWERHLNEKGDWYRHQRGKQVNGNTQQRLFRKISQDLGL